MLSRCGNWLLLLSLLIILGKTRSTYYPYNPGKIILILFLLSLLHFFFFTESNSHSANIFRIKSDLLFFVVMLLKMKWCFNDFGCLTVLFSLQKSTYQDLLDISKVQIDFSLIITCFNKPRKRMNDSVNPYIFRTKLWPFLVYILSSDHRWLFGLWWNFHRNISSDILDLTW